MEDGLPICALVEDSADRRASLPLGRRRARHPQRTAAPARHGIALSYPARRALSKEHCP